MVVTDPDGSQLTVYCSRVEIGNTWHFRGNAEKYMASNDIRHSTSEGHYFLLSDNRDWHDDSRDFGDIPQNLCTERIFFRLWGKEGWVGSDDRMTFIR
jgi:signal peptidase I